MDKTERLYERLVLVLLIALFSFLMYVTGQSDARLAGKDIASMDVPKVIFGLLLILCCIKLINNLAWWNKNRHAGGGNGTDVRVYTTMVFIVLYAILFNVVGFCLSTFLFVTGTSQVLRPTNPWKKAAVIGVLVTVCTYVIFGVLFDVYFPEPIIELMRG
ncbi:MAG: tripartite tricarboxylate transporter TctB family protein [Clostridium sp.]|nr:tripartite tricarboxylate transporter TctB family protein [Clostridium sp.]